MEGGPGTANPRHISYRGVTLKQAVAAAYGVRPFQVTGPEWIDGAGAPAFDLTATMPAGTTRETFEQMLQRLLARSFKLAVHDAPREFPAYELRLGDATPALTLSAQRAGTMFTTPRKGGIEIKSVGGTMAMLASALEQQLDGTAVIDETNLAGNYDFVLLFGAEAGQKKSLLPPLGDAIQRELGLKLVRGTASLDVLVIDHAEWTPSKR